MRLTSNGQKQENSCSPRRMSCPPSEGRAQVGALRRSRALGYRQADGGPWGLRTAHTAAEAKEEFQELLCASWSTAGAAVQSVSQKAREPATWCWGQQVGVPVSMGGANSPSPTFCSIQAPHGWVDAHPHWGERPYSVRWFKCHLLPRYRHRHPQE